MFRPFLHVEIAAALIDKKGRNSVPLRKKKKSIGLSLERRTDGPNTTRQAQEQQKKLILKALLQMLCKSSDSSRLKSNRKS